MTTTSTASTDQLPMRVQVAALLRTLRGPVLKVDAAEHLGIARQALDKLERGALSLDRLDELATSYGVRFVIVAQAPTDPPLQPIPPSPAPDLAHLVRTP